MLTEEKKVGLKKSKAGNCYTREISTYNTFQIQLTTCIYFAFLIYGRRQDRYTARISISSRGRVSQWALIFLAALTSYF